MDDSNRNAARRALLKSALGVGLAGAATAVFAQARKYGPGASDTEIVIGNTAPYSGPASVWGAVGTAYGAYFRMINDQGGINGRRIRYVSLDDAYSPPKTLEQVRRLVEKEQVLLMFGMIGSSTVVAAQKYLEERKVPNLFIASGATRWGDYQKYPYTMGFNFNYTAEGKAYAQYLLKEKPAAKVAVLYQNDEMGRDEYAGLKAGLGDKAREMIIAERSYEVTDPTVDSQIISLHASGADTFVNFSSPKFAALAIRKVGQLGWKPTHLLTRNSNSVGSVLTPAGLDKSIGLITTSYMKDPTDPQWANDPAVIECRSFIEKYLPGGGLETAFGATVYATTLVQVLRQCGDDLTRENVMRQAANLKGFPLGGLLPGIQLNTSPTDYYPIERLRMQRFDGKRWVLFGDLLGKD